MLLNRIFQKENLYKFNYYLLTLTLAFIIWGKELFININGESKGIYAYLILITNSYWISYNLYVFVKKRIIKFKLKKIFITSTIYFSTFSLSSFIYENLGFSFIKFVCFILFSSLIYEIKIKNLRDIIFKSGIIGSFIYGFLYLRAFIFNKDSIFNADTGRLILNAYNPNTLAISILTTILFLSAGEKNIKNIFLKLSLFLTYSYLCVGLIQTQSRSYIVIGIINLLILAFFNFREKIILFSSLPISIVFLLLFDSMQKIDPEIALIDRYNYVENTKPINLFFWRIFRAFTDTGGGRLKIWNECYDFAPINLIIKIYNYPNAFLTKNLNCESYTSHNLLIDIFSIKTSIFLKLFYFFSIYIFYLYTFIESINQKNYLTLNFTVLSIIASQLHNILQEPIFLVLFPITFQLLNGSKVFQDINEDLKIAR